MERWLHNTRGLLVCALAVATGAALLAIDPGDGYPRGVGTVGAAVASTTTAAPGPATTAKPGGTATTAKPGATATTVKSSGATTTTAPRPTLQLNSSGADVTNLQNRLNALGFNVGTVDGSFGPNTRAKVIAFQQAKGLTATGIVDAATWAALDKG